jgi:hypothetical protein
MERSCGSTSGRCRNASFALTENSSDDFLVSLIVICWLSFSPPSVIQFFYRIVGKLDWNDRRPSDCAEKRIDAAIRSAQKVPRKKHIDAVNAIRRVIQEARYKAAYVVNDRSPNTHNNFSSYIALHADLLIFNFIRLICKTYRRTTSIKWFSERFSTLI